MSVCSRHRGGTPVRRRRIALVFVLLLSGCVAPQARCAKKTTEDPTPVRIATEGSSQPTADQNESVPAPTHLPSVVQPVAYEQGTSEEIPALPAAEVDYPLDMSTALALVAGQNPQVGFAQARIRE